MDIIQIFGDYVHLLGMVILLAKIWLTKNCAGISGKTQLLYAMVFTARATDLTIRYVSVYNAILKIIYVGITYCTVLSIFLFFRKTYDRKRDAFRIELLILPCAVFGLFLNRAFETVEVLWTFGAYLEAVAIVPQVYLVSKSKQVESVIVSYVSCLGLYRGCYLMHWLYAYLRHSTAASAGSTPDHIAVASGIVQLIFYCDFFARNLPILKPKGSASSVHSVDAGSDKEPTPGRIDAERDGSQVGKDGGEATLIVGMPAASLDVDEGGEEPRNSRVAQQMVVALDSGRLTVEEKVTLLASKEQGTSN